ncbi:MAG: hypothetical protein L3J78_01465 [Thermoplasmata archaeon]|nr:hypothetical protein [Thermoplasmata archaeon]
MTDLAVLAIGFGLMPLAVMILVPLRDRIEAHQEAVWGAMAGIVAFLGLSHAMGFVLANKPLLAGTSGEAAAAAFLLAGLAFGAATGWFLLEGPLRWTEPSRVVWAAAAFVLLHSFGDGLVLGRDFVGAGFPVLPLDSVTLTATFAHRFAEGAIVLIPALAARWPPRLAFAAVLVSIASIPAAYVPGGLTQTMGLSAGNGTVIALSSFLGAMEASVALFVLVRAFLPIAAKDRGSRWLAWTAVGFIGISLVHFLVE